jgi:hypothetical protein
MRSSPIARATIAASIAISIAQGSTPDRFVEQARLAHSGLASQHQDRWAAALQVMLQQLLFHATPDERQCVQSGQKRQARIGVLGGRIQSGALLWGEREGPRKHLDGRGKRGTLAALQHADIRGAIADLFGECFLRKLGQVAQALQRLAEAGMQPVYRGPSPEGECSFSHGTDSLSSAGKWVSYLKKATSMIRYQVK